MANRTWKNSLPYHWGLEQLFHDHYNLVWDFVKYHHFQAEILADMAEMMYMEIQFFELDPGYSLECHQAPLFPCAHFHQFPQVQTALFGQLSVFYLTA